MKKTFPGHFASDPADLKHLWEDSLIVLDANVLLSLYRYSDGTKNEFLDVFEKLKARLWLPHQFAKEYLKNRLKVISDQAKSYDAAIQGLEDLRDKFKNPKQHPFVSSEVLEDCNNSFDLIVGELRANKQRHDHKLNDDDIKVSVNRIFEGKVGSPYTETQLVELIDAGALRYANKVPPGFKDANPKSGGVTFEEKLAPYGDYIGWKQVLEKAATDQCNVIFVTGDTKEDWWLEQSGRTIGPHPALIDEFVEITSHKFYMYSPDGFLEHASGYLKQDVSPQAMEEARQVRNEDLSADSVSDYKSSFLRNYIRRKNNIPHRDAISHLKKSYRFDSLKGMTVSSALESVKSEAEGLKWKLFQLTAEANQRLVGDPTEQFSHLGNDELELQLSEMRLELEEILNVVDALTTLADSSPG